MEIQIDMTTGERIKATAINFIIADGYPAYFTKDNEESALDFEDIDTLIITDSPTPNLAAENERLRAALEQIAAGNPAPPGGKWLSDAKMAMIARAALKAEEGVHPEQGQRGE